MLMVDTCIINIIHVSTMRADVEGSCSEVHKGSNCLESRYEKRLTTVDLFSKGEAKRH